MAALSVILITFNEEKNIERCLQSVRWADEIIVLDSYSTDRTVELARRFTSHVFQHSYDGDIPQRERGFAKATGGWLFYIDADEEVSSELMEEIKGIINARETKDGYYVPRKVAVLGRWIMHGGWYPDYTLRLFRREKYRAEHAEVHGGFAVDGEKGRLHGFLHHYTYATIEQYLAKMNDYTSLQVSNKLREDPNINISWIKIFLSPPSHFFRKFISNKGYKDGFVGFILAALGAIYTLGLYAKLWEYRMRKREGKGLLPPMTNVELQPYKRA
ncbi:MAG: glycosyltransferase family 2 protein [Ignavibacteriae bacterium]|nr:glycosyltransferase family 2 protein [Ignavibacteria bacterium]MBI3364075.1 glycosyltransferase family 2 protein [Ignavibacteriota bacterium]